MPHLSNFSTNCRKIVQLFFNHSKIHLNDHSGDFLHPFIFRPLKDHKSIKNPPKRGKGEDQLAFLRAALVPAKGEKT